MMVSYGAQLKSEKELTEIREFQFTHPHGVRRKPERHKCDIL